MKGSIRPLPSRGPDVWQARWYIGTDARGRKLERTRTFRAVNRREANRLAASILAELEAEAVEQKSNAGTVGDWARRWLKRKERDLSPTTINGGYKLITDRIIERFGKMPLDAVRPADVREWHDALRATGKSPRTVERHHAVLRAMYRDALEDEMIDRVPIPKSPKTQPTNLNLPTDKQIGALLAEAVGDFGRFVRLASLTGMRRGELLGLRWSDIEPTSEGMAVVHVRRSVITLGAGKVGVKAPKTGRERTVLIGAEGAAVIAEQLESIAEQLNRDVPHDGAVFADVRRDRTGATPRQPGWATQRWGRLARKHGVKMRLHDIRHAHASRLVAAGVDIKSIADRMGHADATMTLNVYSHATSAGELAAARAAAIDSD